ncbi:MAG: ECF transporter S component [Bacilli bacterium]
MKKTNLKETAGLAIFAAIIIVMAAIPQVGYFKIPVLAFDLTLLFIPVLVGTTLYGRKGGLILGLVFGLSSLAVAFMRPATPFDLTFRNPLISVLPRVIFPLVYLFMLDISKKLDTFKLSIVTTIALIIIVTTFIITDMSFVFILFATILTLANVGFIFYCKKHPEKKLIYVLPTFISIIFHGLFVLSMIALFYSQTFIDTFQNQNVVYMVAFVLVSNSFLEAILSSLIIQLIMPAIKRGRDE